MVKEETIDIDMGQKMYNRSEKISQISKNCMLNIPYDTIIFKTILNIY